MPFWGKILVLGEKALQSHLVLDLTVNILLPRLTVKSADLQTFAIDYLNKTLETYTDKFCRKFGFVLNSYRSSGRRSACSADGAVVAGRGNSDSGIVYLIYRFIQFCWDWLYERPDHQAIYSGEALVNASADIRRIIWLSLETDLILRLKSSKNILGHRSFEIHK